MSISLEKIKALLAHLEFGLEDEQPHIGGERALMAKTKLVLIGRRAKDNLRAVFKVSTSPTGKEEIRKEREARKILMSVAFAENSIFFPAELLWAEEEGMLIWGTEFIEQEKVFVAHTLEEQFFLALGAFEAQEGFHATTHEHLAIVKKVFPVFYAQEYFKELVALRKVIREKYTNPELEKLLDRAEEFFHAHKTNIDMYCNYLTHTDFVPHNFRVRDGKMYLLDCAPEARTVHFGNKYEGWARFLNYMIIHNPELELLLSKYILDNRGEADYLSLRLMRVYKIIFLLGFYAEALGETTGDLHKLTRRRLYFWQAILEHVLADTPIPTKLVEEYKKERDSLRSAEEKKRQKEFALA